MMAFAMAPSALRTTPTHASRQKRLSTKRDGPTRDAGRDRWASSQTLEAVATVGP